MNGKDRLTVRVCLQDHPMRNRLGNERWGPHISLVVGEMGGTRPSLHMEIDISVNRVDRAFAWCRNPVVAAASLRRCAGGRARPGALRAHSDWRAGCRSCLVE